MNPERLFESSVSEAEILEIFRFYRFKAPKQADMILQNMVHLLGGDFFFIKTAAYRLFGILKTMSDPDRSFNNFLRFLENTRSPFMNFNFITQNVDILKATLRIFSDSQFFSDILIKNPDYLDWLIYTAVGTEKDYQSLLDEALSIIKIFQSEDSKIMALRRFQKKEFLRIGTNDLMGKSSLETVVKELSFLADVCMEIVYQIKKEVLEKKEPIDGELAIFSMGKLGGLELNYSSDIDIIFAGSGNLFQVTRLAVEIHKELSYFSAEGYFYRVDTRLRPEGDRGVLVRNIESFQSYFENRARVWERQAYLKLRFSAGNEKLGKELTEASRRFVFRKYLSIEEINTIKQLKKRIEFQALQKKEWKREVKTGYGGIRDIEFFVQFVQLLYGGKYEELKTGNTLKALSFLQSIDFISYNEYNTIYHHYVFLRRIEHFLQIMEYQQTHVLPEKEEQKTSLAIRMNFKDLKSFENHYETVTEEVRSIFKKYFEDVFEESKANLAEILYSASKPEDIQFLKEEYGFEDIHKVFHLIKNAGINTKNEFLFLSTLETIFKALKFHSFNSDKSLVNIIRIIHAYRGADVFFDIIKNSKDFLNILVRITSFSDMIVEIVEKNPAVLDLLTELVILKKPTNKRDLVKIFCSLKQELPLEKALTTLFEMEIFRIASQDILNIETNNKISYSLSILAETLLSETLKEILKNKKIKNFAVVFMGKLAGKEISYHSDLDMIFVIDDEEYEDSAVLTKAVQESVQLLKRSYEIDLRLRPDGKNAPLVSSFQSFSKYLKTKGENWERLIYSKARVYSFYPELKKKLKDVIDDFVFQYPENFKANIIEMRKKIVDNFPAENFKKHLGGIMDIEFIAEYTKTVRKIKGSNYLNLIRKMQKVEKRDFWKELENGYLFLRRLENNIRLLHNSYSSAIPEDTILQKLIALKMNFKTKEELFENYFSVRESVARLWEEFVRE
ncbi:MAG TPA: hypothetical protein DHW82_00575 [Spirochaetia bacterium]|nr:MAG: hypothetical protein A2Y41_04390 [Spirochaetes bacterium GWB1_36_13]HCL55494.1 hypothetical protein [Spirochaetia bacterium]